MFPAGEDSWCSFKRAEAAGVAPESYTRKNLYLTYLTPEMLKMILQVFVDLTSPSLLDRCLRKKTQNRNESLHSKLWRKCAAHAEQALHSCRAR